MFGLFVGIIVVRDLVEWEILGHVMRKHAAVHVLFFRYTRDKVQRVGFQEHLIASTDPFHVVHIVFNVIGKQTYKKCTTMRQ